MPTSVQTGISHRIARAWRLQQNRGEACGLQYGTPARVRSTQGTQVRGPSPHRTLTKHILDSTVQELGDYTIQSQMQDITMN